MQVVLIYLVSKREYDSSNVKHYSINNRRSTVMLLTALAVLWMWKGMIVR